MIKLSRSFIVFDFETTGPNPESDRAVSVKMARFEGEFSPAGLTKEYQSLIRPGIPIPREASHGVGGKYPGHGITDAMVNGCRVCGGAPLDTSGVFCTCETFTPWPKFSDLAANLAKRFTNADFGGFNIRFDLQIARNELQRCGIEWDSGDSKLIDGLRIWQVKRPSTLADAAKEFLGEEMKDAHDAGADVDTTIRVIGAQLERWPDLPHDLAALDAICFPGKIDAEAKFIFNEEGTPVVNFGKKWKGEPLNRATMCRCSGRCDCLRGYLQWMLKPKQNFAPSTKRVAREALEGRFPIPPANFKAGNEDQS
jgi:DNA polymerase-3 subunit epsilon